MKSIRRYYLISILVLATGESLMAQFYQVYGYMTPGANEKELVYWNTYIPSSDHSYPFFGDTVGRKGLMAHSLEVEYGLSSRFSVALYADFEQPRGEDLRWIMTKAVAAYYRLFDKNFLPVDLAIYAEYKLPHRGYKDSEELEFKLIMEKDLGFHRIILNPTFEKKISGEGVSEGMEAGLSGAYTYVKSKVFQPRLEYFSKMGELSGTDPFGDQENYLFPSFDLYFGKYLQFRWQAGVGIGLTQPADNLIIKSILSWGLF